MRFSLLHASDLHRDPADEVDTPTLLNSLERDIERYAIQEPAILAPAACLVTGDLIYGVAPTATNADNEIERQYADALEFLVGLTDRFFAGARERVVILPGNHDVSYPAVVASTARIVGPHSQAEREKLVRELFAPRSRLRWSWNELCFYRIVDEDRYQRRLEHFAKFYAAFYEHERTYPLVPERHFDIFDLSNVPLSIFSLSSCFNNDPLRRAAAFHPATLTEVSKAARSPLRSGRLLGAAWHHNVMGGPLQDDYLDGDCMQLLIDSGVSLAFHGHQHFGDCVEERYRVGPGPRKITIFSAGTLCAGAKYLAPGIPRSFNVIEVDTDVWTTRVHQRSMINRTYNLPMWGPGHFNATNRSFLDIAISPPLEVRPTSLDNKLILERAERLIGERRWQEAVAALADLPDAPLARPLLVRALAELDEPTRIITELWPPLTAAEAVLVGGAIHQGGTRADATAFIALPIVANTVDASVRDIAQRVRDRRLL